MKYIFPITSAIALLLVLWAFLSGKISLKQKSDQPAASAPLVKSQDSSIGTTTKSAPANTNNLRVNPKPRQTVPVQSNVTINRPVVSTTSDYSLKVLKKSSIQAN